MNNCYFQKYSPSGTSCALVNFEISLPLKYTLLFLLLATCSICRLNALPANNAEVACDLVNESSINVTGGSCDNLVRVCLTASLSDMANYNITDNGMPYTGMLGACVYDTSFAYTYFSLPGSGNSGPYTVDSWTVNGNTNSGPIANMVELVDSMNSWDPSGNWYLDMVTTSIRGGATFNTYSSLIISHPASGNTTVIEINIGVSPNDEGTALMLEPGFHQIEVNDPVMGCSDIVFIIISCVDCPNTYSGQKEFQLMDCGDVVDICTDIPLADTAVYQIWDNGILIPNSSLKGCNEITEFAYDYSGLAGQGSGGPFILQNWEVNGSAFLGFFSNMTNLADAMDSWDPTGDWIHDPANLRIIGGNQSTTYSAIQLQQQSNPSPETVLLSTITTYGNVQITLANGTHELIISNTVQSCLDTNFIEVTCEQCPDILGNPITLDNGNCETNGVAEFCLNVPTDDLIFHQILDNGQLFNGNMNGCNPDTALYFSLAGLPNPDNPWLFSVQDWTINGQSFSAVSFSSYQQLADSMSAWDAPAAWQIDSQTIKGGDKSNDYGDLLLGFGPNTPEVLPLRFTIFSQNSTLELGTGMHNILLTNTMTGCVDSVLVNVTCTADACPNPLPDYPGRLSTDNCTTPASWCIDLPPDVLLNYEIRINEYEYEELITACDFRIISISYNVSALQQGNRDPFELTAWLVNGQLFSGSFPGVQTLVDSLNSWNPSGLWSYDVVEGTINSSNTDDSYSALHINFTTNSSTLTIPLEKQEEATASSLAIYAGQQQIILSNSITGCQDTFAVLIDCISTEWITDTVLINATDTICLATDQLIGNLVSMENICASSAGEFVLFEEQKDQFCVAYTGIEVGNESACIRICDDLGLCDTTYLNIFTIDENHIAPWAIDDTITTVKGVSVNDFDVSGNDSNATDIDTLYILTYPTYGMATVNLANHLISYSPNAGYCNSTTPDEFEYVLCTQYGCDTGKVNVVVFCDEIRPFSGFSPNGDNLNDRFAIEGIEVMPNNRLSIFNRWGNQVYRKENYQNGNDGWDGTFDGVNVPDGTYFYLLEGGNGRIYSGYVQLSR